MMKKRFVSILLSLCFMLFLTPSVYATNNDIFNVGNLNYRISKQNQTQVTVQSVASVPQDGKITIPAEVTYNKTTYTVKGIEGNSIGGNSASLITSVDMPGNSEAFTTIQDGAFQGCTSIRSLTIPASVTKIGSIGISDQIGGLGAFDNMTALESITFAQGSKLETLGSNTFLNCSSLTSLELPSGLKNIGTAVVEGCTRLSQLTIPKSVENMSTLVFIGYYKNEKGQINVRLEEGGKFKLQDGILYKENTLMKAYEFHETVIVPEGITTIRENAFASIRELNDTTTSLILPNSLCEIGSGAFVGCTALQTVDFKENAALTNISEGAFTGCSSLKEITIPIGVKNIGNEAFAGCIGLETIVLPEGLETIGDAAFMMFEIVDGEPDLNSKNEQIKSINIPSTITSLGEIFLGGINENTVIISMVQKPDQIFTEEVMAGLGEDLSGSKFIVPEELKNAYTQAGLIEETAVDKNEQAFALDIPVSTSVKVGQTVTLTVNSTIPNGATLEWSSDKTDIATVTNGTITGVKAGNATITASIKLNGVTLVSDTCAVTVNENTSGGGGGGGSSSGGGSTSGTQFVKHAVYRAYNPNSGEHFYTPNYDEFKFITSIGWHDEGIACMTETKTNGHTLYRLYNPNSGLHHYTLDENEKNVLVSLGWNDEDVAWYTSKKTNDPAVYRLYNLNDGQHHYTMDVKERDALVKLGWTDEGVGYHTSPIKK